jgi:hypothetical protein
MSRFNFGNPGKQRNATPVDQKRSAFAQFKPALTNRAKKVKVTLPNNNDRGNNRGNNGDRNAVSDGSDS